jgi:hypothetical protein
VAFVASETDLAWAAGFFDGEGSTSVLKAQRDKYSYIRMSVNQKKPECLERFHSIVGFGKIYRANKRDIYSWDCYKQSDVPQVLEMLWPYLSNVKKEQALRAMERVKENSKGE